MSTKSKIIGAAVGALGLVGLTGAAQAISLTPPGERVGLDLASPLPEGVYFVDIGIVGGNPLDAPSGASMFNGNVPVLAWSTPWNILGGHITLYGALPEAETGYDTVLSHGLGALNGFANTAYSTGLYNPFLAGSINWNLGNGWSVGYLAGVYLPMTGNTWNTGPGGVELFDATAFHQMLAVAYHQNNWNFTANVQYGIAGNTGGSAGICNATLHTLGGGCQVLWGDYFNYDVALTKTFGKWEFGMVGYGSFDTSTTVINSGLITSGLCATPLYTSVYGKTGCGKQSQFALGGLVGYNFGPVITQFILANDVYEQNYGRYNTQAIIHVIVPLWNPETPKVVTAKY
jgi:hypothetical protein